tara:strand:- start:771 stop:1307 length:537 start_codon:yes stop_codon:yes gene_type:complete
MKRPGLTLIETLIALSLLAMMTVAVVSWMVSSQRLLCDASGAARWNAATAAALQLIADDLTAATEGDSDDGASAVLVESDSLQIRTRDVGACTVRYSLDRGAGQLTRQRTDASGSTASPRLLVGNVADWTVAQSTTEDVAALDNADQILTIAITASDGSSAIRSFRLGTVDRRRELRR